MHDLKAGMAKYPQILINVSVAGAVDLHRAPIVEAVRTVERRLGDCGRVLLRLSGTEPVVRAMVEGAYAGTVERHARAGWGGARRPVGVIAFQARNS